jgi:hypothetical protein
MSEHIEYATAGILRAERLPLPQPKQEVLCGLQPKNIAHKSITQALHAFEPPSLAAR